MCRWVIFPYGKKKILGARHATKTQNKRGNKIKFNHKTLLLESTAQVLFFLAPTGEKTLLHGAILE